MPAVEPFLLTLLHQVRSKELHVHRSRVATGNTSFWIQFDPFGQNGQWLDMYPLLVEHRESRVHSRRRLSSTSLVSIPDLAWAFAHHRGPPRAVDGIACFEAARAPRRRCKSRQSQLACKLKNLSAKAAFGEKLTIYNGVGSG